MTKHLAVFDLETSKRIFDGSKKVEGRFSKIKIDPFCKVSTGDVVYIKVSGEKIVGQFIVDRVFYFDHPSAQEFLDIKKKYGRDLDLEASFWKDREKINYISLMFIRSVNHFLIPPEVTKKDLRGWVVLGDE